jgi:hypothetical protein
MTVLAPTSVFRPRIVRSRRFNWAWLAAILLLAYRSRRCHASGRTVERPEIVCGLVGNHFDRRHDVGSQSTVEEPALA